MHIKHIHETMEKLSKYACEEACKNVEEIDTKELGEVVDMISDLAKAEYHARISKAMEEEEKDEQEEIKHIMREMKEQYGEEEGERRFYDNYRYANGRFAPKGRGTRRGYTPVYRMTPEMYRENSPEYYRDMDKQSRGVMYFSSPISGGNMEGNGRAYTEGYSDGNRKGYEEGMRDGERMGRNSQLGSRYENAKRSYQEVKSVHNSGSTEDKKIIMKEIEKVIDVVMPELQQLVENCGPEVKSLVKTKVTSELQKI